MRGAVLGLRGVTHCAVLGAGGVLRSLVGGLLGIATAAIRRSRKRCCLAQRQQP
jgi:hypothetical protein